jgi:hypothetical protein
VVEHRRVLLVGIAAVVGSVAILWICLGFTPWMLKLGCCTGVVALGIILSLLTAQSTALPIQVGLWWLGRLQISIRFKNIRFTDFLSQTLENNDPAKLGEERGS